MDNSAAENIAFLYSFEDVSIYLKYQRGLRLRLQVCGQEPLTKLERNKALQIIVCPLDVTNVHSQMF